MAGSSVINGAIVQYSAHVDRWIAAQGDNVVEFFDDFVAAAPASNALPGWTTTLVNSSTLTAADASGGAIVLTTDGAENDGVNSQVSKENFKLSADNSLYFGIKMQASEATQSDFFVGLSVTNTDILGNLPKRIGFRKVDGATGIGFDSEGTVETTVENLATFADATDITLEFVWDAANSVARVYADGTLKNTVALGTALPDTEVAVSLQFLTGAASAETLTVDWVRVIQVGR